VSLDRKHLRWPLALLLIGWLVFMGQGYAETIQQRTRWVEDCKDEVAACGDRKVFLALVEVIELDEQAFVVRKTISVIARFDAEQDLLIEEWRESHPWREEKEALGFVGLGLAALVLVGGFRLGRDGLDERA
jgi:hypothetical protein